MHSVTDGETETDRQTERQRDRHTERQRDNIMMGRVNPTAYGQLKIETDGLNN